MLIIVDEVVLEVDGLTLLTLAIFIFGFGGVCVEVALLFLVEDERRTLSSVKKLFLKAVKLTWVRPPAHIRGRDRRVQMSQDRHKQQPKFKC